MIATLTRKMQVRATGGAGGIGTRLEADLASHEDPARIAIEAGQRSFEAQR